MQQTHDFKLVYSSIPSTLAYYKRRRSSKYRCDRGRTRHARRHITQQAQIIAHIDDYKLLMIATLAVLPRLIVFKKAPGGSADHTLAVE
jgi:hypothetical protein